MKNNIIKGLIVATIIAITSVTIQSSYAYNLDKSYKEALVRDSGNANYTVKNMAPILGEKELTKIIKKYDNHPEYFIADVNEKGDQIGVKELTYRGGFHSHTTASDGKMEPIDALEQARDYAQKVKSKHPFRKYPVILAYTDHYNTNGCKEVIDIIQKNPEKYKNVKIILGMETTIRFLNTDQFLLIAFVGLITGVGGGILRDLLAGEIPYVLQKHIYATACIFGIIGYYILYHFIPEIAAALIGFCLVLVIRYLAKHFEWNLPR